jgi:hypothetical protein
MWSILTPCVTCSSLHSVHVSWEEVNISFSHHTFPWGLMPSFSAFWAPHSRTTPFPSLLICLGNPCADWSSTQPLKKNSLPWVFVYYLMGKRILSESSDTITQNVIPHLGFEYTEIKQLLGGMKTMGETVPSTLACQVGKLRSSSNTMGI